MMEVESEYRRENVYVSDVDVQEGANSPYMLRKLGDNSYMYQGDDTIVSNRKIEEDSGGGIGWLNSQEKGRICYVDAGTDIDAASLEILSPQAFSYENTNMLEIGSSGSRSEDNSLVFYAYGGGHYLAPPGIFRQQWSWLTIRWTGSRRKPAYFMG